MSKLFSYQTEMHVLGGLIKNPQVFADVDVIISDKDFYSPVHSTIFSCIKNIAFEGGEIDAVTVAQKIKNLGISFGRVLPINSTEFSNFNSQINSWRLCSNGPVPAIDNNRSLFVRFFTILKISIRD